MVKRIMSEKDTTALEVLARQLGQAIATVEIKNIEKGVINKWLK